MGDGWRRWFVRDGRLRTLWRALLFVAVFLAILQLELLILLTVASLTVASLPVPEAGLSTGLILQMALVLVAAVLAGLVMLRWIDGRPATGLGEALGLAPGRRVPLELLAGLAIGAGVMVAVVMILAALGAVRYVAAAGSVAGWLTVSAVSLAAFAIPAAAEEALFRGYLFRTLEEGAGAVVAIVATSVLFTIAHGYNPNVTPLGLVNIFLAGLLLGVAVLRTGTLWLAIGLHLGWNWVMAGPLDLPVSGIGGYDMPLYDVAASGPTWLTGGAFGPEGGVAGSAAAILGLTLVLWSTRPGGALAGNHGDRREVDVEDR